MSNIDKNIFIHYFGQASCDLLNHDQIIQFCRSSCSSDMFRVMAFTGNLDMLGGNIIGTKRSYKVVLNIFSMYYDCSYVLVLE